MPSNTVSLYPSGTGNTNYYTTANMDNMGFLDTAGDEYGLLSTGTVGLNERASRWH